jgi:hypothetical protein
MIDFNIIYIYKIEKKIIYYIKLMSLCRDVVTIIAQYIPRTMAIKFILLSKEVMEIFLKHTKIDLSEYKLVINGLVNIENYMLPNKGEHFSKILKLYKTRMTKRFELFIKYLSCDDKMKYYNNPSIEFIDGNYRENIYLEFEYFTKFIENNYKPNIYYHRIVSNDPIIHILYKYLVEGEMFLAYKLDVRWDKNDQEIVKELLNPTKKIDNFRELHYKYFGNPTAKLRLISTDIYDINDVLKSQNRYAYNGFHISSKSYKYLPILWREMKYEYKIMDEGDENDRLLFIFEKYFPYMYSRYFN